MSYRHIFKLDSSDRFVSHISSQDFMQVSYDALKRETMGTRLCLEGYLEDSEELEKPYWVTEKSSHLLDRVIALNHMIIDMLKLGDFPMAFYVQKKTPEEYMAYLTKKNVKDLSLSPNFSARQVALTFFMVSHYICAAHMPLHCDLRDMASETVDGGAKEKRLPKPLHPGIEAVWEKSFPSKSRLILHKYMEGVRREDHHQLAQELIDCARPKSHVQAKPDIIHEHAQRMGREGQHLPNRICRRKRKWIPHSFAEIQDLIGAPKCKKEASPLQYEDIITIIGEDEFTDITNRIFHDAVESVARLRHRAWNIFTK